MKTQMPGENGERDGRVRGGEARAKSLSKAQRSSIARKAANARWDPAIPEAVYGSPDTPLLLGGIALDCYVLDTRERVFSQRGLIGAFGLKPRGGEFRRFVEQVGVRGMLSDDALAALDHPIQFHPPAGGRSAFGYPVTLLVDICNAVLEARASVPDHYKDSVIRAEVIVRAVAKTGIIALVDEITGYEQYRQQTLQDIFDQYLRKELAAWSKRFPDAFYRQIFRLRGWEWRGRQFPTPWHVASITKDLVYKRLAPGILKKLEEKNPSEGGRRKSKHHQWLSDKVGIPSLDEHLHTVIAFMKASDSWNQLMTMMNRALPIQEETAQLPLLKYDPLAALEDSVTDMAELR